MDVDGVLVPGPGCLFAELLDEQFGITPDHTDSFFKGPFVECLTGGADLRTTLPPYLAKWGWPGTVDTFLETWFTTEQDKNYGVLSIVEQVKILGVKVYLATNQERHRLK